VRELELLFTAALGLCPGAASVFSCFWIFLAVRGSSFCRLDRAGYKFQLGVVTSFFICASASGLACSGVHTSRSWLPDPFSGQAPRRTLLFLARIFSPPLRSLTSPARCSSCMIFGRRVFVPVAPAVDFVFPARDSFSRVRA
jgi:hypothetical protein